MNGTILSIESLAVHYGGVVAVNDVTLDVKQNSFVGLIGPNGAGKTTLIDAVCGFVDCKGSISFCGERIDGLAAFERSRLGVARTFQAGELFDDLTVVDNVIVGAYRGSLKGSLREILFARPAIPSRHVLEILEIFGLDQHMNREVRELPVGSRKLVSVARALAGAPSLLLLDEPAAGLDSSESKQLGEALRQLPETGVTIVLVDHDVDLVLGVCDIVHALDAGQIIASGTGDEIRAHPEVMASYLGVPAVENTQ